MPERDPTLSAADYIAPEPLKVEINGTEYEFSPPTPMDWFRVKRIAKEYDLTASIADVIRSYSGGEDQASNLEAAYQMIEIGVLAVTALMQRNNPKVKLEEVADWFKFNSAEDIEKLTRVATWFFLGAIPSDESEDEGSEKKGTEET